MALKVKKHSYQKRVKLVFIIWLLGMSAMFGVPLSRAVTVRSPSKKSIDNRVLPTSIGSFVSQSITKQKNASVGKRQSGSITSSGSINCNSGVVIHSGLSTAVSPQLKKLAQYEQVCNSAIVSRSSFFTATPTTITEAAEYANDVAIQLREYNRFGVKPLIFLEPTTNAGLVDMNKIQSGYYDSVFDAYFAAVKAVGVTDEMMGIWVPLPEANLPVWTSPDPNLFASCVTKITGYQKKYFPNSKASVLLDTVTYTEPENWDNGKAVSLVPYIKNIPAGLIDSFGLQGFPWSPPANEAGSDNGTPIDYLRIDLAMEAARELNISDIWFNTGTYGSKYTNQAAQTITVSPERRLALLDSVISQAKATKSQGFSVSVHLFAQNKSQVQEATDWSYWPSGQAATSPATYIFKSFVNKLQANGMPLWLFDADETN